jgi:hypothetical protein
MKLVCFKSIRNYEDLRKNLLTFKLFNILELLFTLLKHLLQSFYLFLSLFLAASCGSDNSTALGQR